MSESKLKAYSMDKRLEVFTIYMDAARQFLSENPSAMQVNLFVTDRFHVFTYPVTNFDDTGTEDDCLRRMCETQNTRVVLTVTMWKNGQLDVPSYSLQKRLVEIDPQNKDSCILLLTDKGIDVKRLSVAMSSSAVNPPA